MKPTAPLPRAFYLQDTVVVAREILGCTLWRRIGSRWAAGRIVETEAYLGANDLASHARKGLRSARNEAMYLEGGHAYVYFTYGMHFCMNVVTGERDIAEAVLLRGAQPLEGIDLIEERRPKAKNEYELMNGPGKLCMALEIGREMNGHPLDDPPLLIAGPTSPVAYDDIAVTPRVGIDGAGDATHWPLRFFLSGNRYVSASRMAR